MVQTLKFVKYVKFFTYSVQNLIGLEFSLVMKEFSANLFKALLLSSLRTQEKFHYVAYFFLRTYFNTSQKILCVCGTTICSYISPVFMEYLKTLRHES